MSIPLKLPEELERRLSIEALHRGQSFEECLQALVEEALARPGSLASELAGDDVAMATIAAVLERVGQRNPRELDEIAARHGIAPVLDPRALAVDWSVDDGDPSFDPDAFLQARRDWQCGPDTGFPFDEP